MAGKAKRRAWTEADVKESCQEEDICGQNRKVAQANCRRYETESILSWGFLRFSRIGQNSLCVFGEICPITRRSKQCRGRQSLWGSDKHHVVRPHRNTR